jgi:hypothetical protein
MTGIERRFALLEAIRYLTHQNIPGSIVECGVWRGGSMMLALAELLRLGAATRDAYLYDTFEGMPDPTARDVSWNGQSATYLLKKDSLRKQTSEIWASAPESMVAHNLSLTGYPADRIQLVKGRVEETLARNLPGPIALLRLDTDWYASTLHELKLLYPLLSKGGILIIDDYGHWKGARHAVDEYFANLSPRPMLHRIDYTARIAVKS